MNSLAYSLPTITAHGLYFSSISYPIITGLYILFVGLLLVITTLWFDFAPSIITFLSFWYCQGCQGSKVSFICMPGKCFATGLCSSLNIFLRTPENTCFDLFAQREYIPMLLLRNGRDNVVIIPRLALLSWAVAKFILLGTCASTVSRSYSTCSDRLKNEDKNQSPQLTHSGNLYT